MRPFILILGLAACGDKTGDTASSEIDLSTADIENGQTVHDEVCQVCHSSNSAMADNAASLSDSQLEDVIRNGTGSMPAQSSLSDQDVVDVMGYIRETY
jgi:cytochrome c551